MKYSVFFLTVLLVLSSGVGLNHQPIMKNTPALRTTRRNRPLQLIPKIQLKGDVAQARKLMQRTKFKGFLINRGQNPDRSVKYYMASPSSAIGFSTSMIHLRKKMNGTNIYFSLTFPGSNKVEPQGIKPILTSTNYYLGMVRIGGVATYSEVWYYNLYKGIDLRYYLNSKGLKYEFVVRPGADAQQINIRASDNMRVSLLSGTQLGLLSGGTTLLSDSALQVYQQGKIIPAGFALHSINSYSFHISSYDKAAILTIDPLLLGFSTYLGGSDGDYANGVATDSSGNIYVTGYTLSSNFPTLNAYQKTSGGSYDGFLSKFSPTGSLLFSTYLGGSGGDFANGVATDSTGNAFIIGGTYSTNFPTLNAYHTTNTGGSDAFLSKFSPSGALLFSTYLGGSGDDYGYAAATDSSGNVYVTGETSSRIFPLLNAYQAYYGGSGDAFLSKFSSTGSLLFSTYLGGSGIDYANGVATDSSGNVYLTGSTSSTNFPTRNAYQATSGGGTDAFLSKFSSTGSLLFSTYLGGARSDEVYGAATDSKGNVYLTGSTSSTNFPTRNAYQATSGGGTDAFLSKFSSTGSLLFSTYLGGSGIDFANGVATDSRGNVYLTGDTYSSNFPTSNAYQATFGGGTDAFLSKFSSTGSLLFSTYLGGIHSDFAKGVATDSSGNVYLTGSTSSTNFPTTLGAYQKTSGGSDDAFLTKMDLTPPSQVTGISATPISRSQINLKWKAATDNTAVKAYKVYRNGVFIKTVSGNFTDVGLHEATRYNYTVAAVDTAGNMGQMSLQVSTVTLDLTAPSLVTGLRTTAISGTQINLRWNASTDNVGVTGYKVYRDGVFITTVTTTNFTDSGLSEATTYSYTVEAGDAAGNLGQLSQVSSATTFDTMPPGQVNGVTAIAVSNSSVLLRWNATSDNIAVTGYKIYRDGVLVGTAKGELYLDTGLTPGGKYSYTVAAVDAAGNTGLKSTAISVQTPVPTRTPTQTPTPDQPFTTPQPSTTTNQSPTSTTKGGTPFPFLPLLLGMMLIVVWRRKIKRVFRFK